MRTNRFLALPAMALLALAGPNPSRAETIKIGVSLPLSGPKQSSGEAILNALKLRTRELNEAGGAAGRNLELVVKDDANEPEKGRKAAEELAGEPGVIAVIGHYDDAVALAARDVYNKAGLVIFAPTISNPDFTGKSPWAFSGTYNHESEGELIAAYLKTLHGHKRTAVIHTDDPYGVHTMTCFTRKAKRLGLETSVFSFSEKAETLPEDFVAKRFSKGGPSPDSIVIFAHSVKAAAVIRQLRERGLKMPVYGSDRIATDLIPMLGQHTENVHVAFPFMYDLGTLKTSEFVGRFTREYGAAPTRFAAFAYDGLSMIVDSIQEKGATREAVREGLASHDAEEKAHEGVSGRLWFNSHRTIPRDVVMGEIRRGEFRPDYLQLRTVTEKHTLGILEEKVKLGEVLLVDGTPYFKINVVYAGVDFYRVNQVNLKDLNYEMEFFLWFRWSGDVDVDNIVFLNEIAGKGTRTELRKMTVASKDGGPDEHWASYKVRGTFLDPYDLKLFPFDAQRLPLFVAHKNKNANKLQLVVDRAELSPKALEDIYPQEWRYIGRRDYAGTFNFYSTFGNPTYEPGEVQADYSVYHVDILIKRLLFPYAVTLFLPLGILMAVSMLAVLIPKEQFAPRNGAVMSALLGVLVYHMTTARSLPQVGYLVRADLYFVSAYFFLFALILGVNTVNVLLTRKQEALAAEVDKWFSRAFLWGVGLTYLALTVSAAHSAGLSLH